MLIETNRNQRVMRKAGGRTTAGPCIITSASLMALLSFAAMYVLMYAMVDTFDNVMANVNQFYMAGLMAAPMVVIELALMGMMYPSKRANLAIGTASAILGVAFWFAIRSQAWVGDEQFLRSMIPHHAGAILMCEQAEVSDPEIRKLCGQIIQSQREEIAQMKALLDQQDSRAAGDASAPD